MAIEKMNFVSRLPSEKLKWLNFRTIFLAAEILTGKTEVWCLSAASMICEEKNRGKHWKHFPENYIFPEFIWLFLVARRCGQKLPVDISNTHDCRDHLNCWMTPTVITSRPTNLPENCKLIHPIWTAQRPVYRFCITVLRAGSWQSCNADTSQSSNLPLYQHFC